MPGTSSVAAPPADMPVSMQAIAPHDLIGGPVIVLGSIMPGPGGAGGLPIVEMGG